MNRLEKAVFAAKKNTAFSGSIGTLSEKTLHSALKYYLEPCDDFHEVAVGKYVADIMRDGCITEVQTRTFSRIFTKLDAFLKEYPVTLVFPIAKTRRFFLVSSESGETGDIKISPRHGNVYDIFKELYKIKPLLLCENFYLHIILLDLTEERRTVKKSRRNHKGYELYERIPNSIEEEIFIDSRSDYKALIPNTLQEPFTSADFAKAIKRPRSVASTALNILDYVGAVKRIGKIKNTYLYEKG